MSYYEIYKKYKNTRWDELFGGFSGNEVKTQAASDEQSERQLAALMSNAADGCLEDMARRSHALTLQYFGRTIRLYTPLYLSDYCDNSCVYCGFSSSVKMKRKTLSLDEVEKEASLISKTGLKHILILSGESKSACPLSYIKDCVKILTGYFKSVSIEIYPLGEEEYKELVTSGVDGLTIYQEVYDEDIYAKVHLAGPKSDYVFRLDGPERGSRAGVRCVNIGSLLGLDEWRKEAFLTGMHAKYLQDKFPDVEIGISVPRIRPNAGNFKAPYSVSDRDLAHIIIGFRLFLPRVEITLSTRESPSLRENLIALGVTRISAGSSTSVGGRISGRDRKGQDTQFEISDNRSVEEMMILLERKGYQGVLTDWVGV